MPLPTPFTMFGRGSPRNAITGETEATGLVELFDAESDDSLLAALERSLEGEPPDELSEDFRHRYDPTRIAGEFAGRLSTIAGNGTQV